MNVLPSPGVGKVLWVDLVSRPGSDEIALLYSDDSGNLTGVIWDGTQWGQPRVLEISLNTTDFLAFGAAYESQSGDLLAFWGGPNAGGVMQQGCYYATKPAGSSTWTVSGQLPTPFLRPGQVKLASEAGSDRIALAYLEY